LTAQGRALAAKLSGFAALLAAWQFASAAVGEYWVPGIEAVAGRLWSEALKGALLVDLVATAQLFFAGTAIGLVVGCAFACALRLSPRIDAMLQPFITAVMSVPKLGLVPLLVLWFGTGWAPKVLLVALTVLFIVFSLTYSGLTTVDSRLVMTARVLGADALQITRNVVLPTVWPFVLTGLEVALPWAVSAALVAEYLSAKVGIGHGIEQARQMSDSVGVFYGIVLATVLVLFGNAVLAAARAITVKGQ
jgi:ABC-type nitrate/sulfonate/bicarbonate transport system permease component